MPSNWSMYCVAACSASASDGYSPGTRVTVAVRECLVIARVCPSFTMVPIQGPLNSPLV